MVDPEEAFSRAVIPIRHFFGDLTYSELGSNYSKSDISRSAEYRCVLTVKSRAIYKNVSAQNKKLAKF